MFDTAGIIRETMTTRILHVLPHRGGGGETYVDMVSAGDPASDHRRFYLSRGRSLRQAVAGLPTMWPGLVRASRQASVIHVHGDAASIIALPVLPTRPSVMTTHGLHLLRRTEGVAHLATGRTLRAVASIASAIICTSSSEREELAATLAARDIGKLTIIHNGVDPPPVLGADQRTAIRARLGCGPDSVLGLFVGQLEERKAPLVATRAAEKVSTAGVPFVLALAGDGPLRTTLESERRDGVRLLGHRDDVSQLLRAAEVFVQPSEREGMSLALLEAMASELAVVAADGPGNVEALGTSGLTFPAGDESALAEELIRLSQEPELRRSLGRQAGERALDRFGSARFVAETRAVYELALDGSGRLA
jgi:glycosyltransferase involved in cell wall biosynthesis